MFARRYLESDCFFTGPIVDAILQTDAAEIFNATFDYDIAVANTSDPYVTSPVLQSYLRCVDGPPELQNVPSWLYYGLGRLQVVSIDSSDAPAASDGAAEVGDSALLTDQGRQTQAMRVAG